MTRFSYRCYRSWGHTRTTSFVLSTPNWLWFGSAFVLGSLAPFVSIAIGLLK